MNLKPACVVAKLPIPVSYTHLEGDDAVGEGVTRVLDGVVMMLTGVDEGGVQIGEFGSSEGYLDENIMWNRPSCPDKGEIFIKGNIVICLLYTSRCV